MLHSATFTCITILRGGMKSDDLGTSCLCKLSTVNYPGSPYPQQEHEDIVLLNYFNLCFSEFPINVFFFSNFTLTCSSAYEKM